jgi:hypothetical protein
MDIGATAVNVPWLVALAGLTVAVLGVLVWHANGIVHVTLGRIFEVTVPGSARGGQSITALGALTMVGGILAVLWSASASARGPTGWHNAPVVAAPPSTRTSPPPGTPSPSSQLPGTAPPAAADGASIRITSPAGSPDLGRDVVAAGNVGRRKFACYAIGWYVQTTEDWTAYYIKQNVRPGADGSFRTGVLQMGASGETGSSWWPFVLGGSPAGCNWLRQLAGQTPTGEYRASWPPPGITVLYTSASPIHRTS